MNDVKYRLERSLLISSACLNGHLASMALANGHDPLRLNLPPLLSGEENGLTPSETALRAMAAIYLQAELEQTGLIIVAEALV